MTINTNTYRFKKRTVRDSAGNIIDLLDEANGGYIIKNRQVVNQERYQEMMKVEQDRKEAAMAQALARTDESLPNRNVDPVSTNLKKEFDVFKKEVDDKFNAILEAIKNK